MNKYIFALIGLNLVISLTQASTVSDEKLACSSLHEAALKGLLSKKDQIKFQECIASDLIVTEVGFENKDTNKPGLAGGASTEIRSIINPFGSP